MRKILRSDWTLAGGMALAFVALMLAVAPFNMTPVAAQMETKNGGASPSPSPGLGEQVTSMARMISFTHPHGTVSVCSASSTDTLPSQTAAFVLPSCCGASPIPTATTNLGVRVPVGACVSIPYRPETQPPSCSYGYCQMSVIAYPSPSPTPEARIFVAAP